MKSFIAFFTILILGPSCSKDYSKVAVSNKVLLLQVDYLTNTFEGGKEFTFSTPATTFTIAKDYKQPGDAGYIKLMYQELKEPLFDGSITWAGTGRMYFPENLLSLNEFTTVTTRDIVKPANGFENIFDPYNIAYDYTQAWISAQKLTKVREYLTSNPTATVKLFLYTPGGADAKWIIFLKN